MLVLSVLIIVLAGYAGINIVKSDDRLRIHGLRPLLPPREIYLHWRAGGTRSPLAVRAIEIAVEVAAELSDHPVRTGGSGRHS
jgi:hypothetical protein